VSQCYWLHLSVPSSAAYEYYPELFISNMMLVEAGTDLTTDTPCPYELRNNESIAQICHTLATDTWDVTHYGVPMTGSGTKRQVASPWLGFGQTVPSSVSIVNQIFDTNSLVKLGKCRLAADPTPSPTSIPTKSPLCPTPIPTTSNPTAAPSPMPVSIPSVQPTAVLSVSPTLTPSLLPTTFPSAHSTTYPSNIPTSVLVPSQPSDSASFWPTSSPTPNPSVHPKSHPALQPSSSPTATPSARPTSRPTSAPTLLPTSIPSPEPTTPAPTVQPSSKLSLFINPFDRVDYSCLKSCPFFPGGNDDAVDVGNEQMSIFESNTSTACEFLEVMYADCNTVQIATGTCPVPECARNCSVDVWCYFGAGTTSNCPNWLPVTCDEQTASIRSQCVESLTPAVVTRMPSTDYDASSKASVSKSDMRLTLEIGMRC
jgi:hypothetical protein